MTFPELEPLSADPGLWRQVFRDPSARAAEPGPALFLDRDGVIVEEVNYLHLLEDIAIIPGAAAVIEHCTRPGTPVSLVPNQSAVARGYHDGAQLAAAPGYICLRRP